MPRNRLREHRVLGAFDRRIVPDEVALASFSWPTPATKLTIAYMAQDGSFTGAGVPDEYTEFSSASDTFEVRGWAYDGDDGGAGADFEVVDDAYFEGVFDDAVDEPARVDPFVTFGSILERAASRAGGAAVDPRGLRVLLGLDRVGSRAFDSLPQSAVHALIDGGVLQTTEAGLARTERFATMVEAWSGILRGESEDFGPCGTQTLDEWAADLVARFLGSTSRGASVRREVRSLGVAAFGLVASAA